MKNLTKVLSLLFLASGLLLVSCKKDDDKKDDTTPTPSSVTAPSALAVSDITSTSAKFTWTGSGDSYEIVIGSQTYTSSTASYTASALTANTNYTWKVRAKKGSDFSSWVDGTAFKTLAATGGSNSMTVQFGATSWTAGNVAGQTNGSVFMVVGTQSADGTGFPAIRIVANLAKGSVAVDTNSSIDYFEKGALTQQGSTTTFGDWWPLSGTLNITNIDGNIVSGNMDIQAFNAKEAYVDKNPNFGKTTIKCTFTVNVSSAQAAQILSSNKVNFSNLLRPSNNMLNKLLSK